MTSFTVRAFAKINLSLRVTGTRPDGFHDVKTVLQAIDVYDRVTVQARRGPFEIRCDMSGVPTDRTNLVWKAAHALWTAAGRRGEPRDVAVRLQKKIPMKAGLGGGSSDAAAALLALRKLWRLRVSDPQIHQLAAGLGSDVPFFLIGGTALGLGRGDEVYPLANLPRYRVVVAIPEFGVATQDAYKWFDEAPRTSNEHTPYTPKKGQTLSWCVSLGNDLEAPVVERHPLIGQLKQRFTDRKALLAAMSGSGSAVFGVFTSEAAAAGAVRALKADGTRILTARFLSRLTRRDR